MAIGPGKYGDALKKVLKEIESKEGLLIVIGGPKGHGFSAVISQESTLVLPTLLRSIADSVEKDNKFLVS